MNMSEKTEKILRLMAFAILVGVFIFIGNYLSGNEAFYKRVLKNREGESYSGVVAEKYVDSAQHGTPMLKLTSTNVVPLENYFWDQVEVGDSIVKIKDQAYITLYKDNKIKEVFDYNVYFDELIQRSKK
jgi:hypothetical protein